MPLTAGTPLGSFEIVSPLGAGGMGEVYRARHLKLGRDVAIKVLPSDLASDPQRRHRFEREARAASALNHPNIVTIHDIDEHDGIHYIAMELVEGRTLRELLAGYSADVEIILKASERVLRVPTEAVLEGYRVLVYRETEGRLEERKIQAGLSNWQFTEVVSGLQAGERVVVSVGREGIRAGAYVVPENSGPQRARP